MFWTKQQKVRVYAQNLYSSANGKAEEFMEITKKGCKNLRETNTEIFQKKKKQKMYTEKIAMRIYLKKTSNILKNIENAILMQEKWYYGIIKNLYLRKYIWRR